MITGSKITSVEAKREKDGAPKGLSINISLEDLKVKGDEVTISYVYTANYEEGVGTLKIAGELRAKEESKMIKEIKEEWSEEKKKLPPKFAELVLNTINFTCGTNGTLVVRPVNLAPPMVPPRIELKSGEGKGEV